MPAGQVKAVRPGTPFQEIIIEPVGVQNGIEEVLIVLGGVHPQIPDMPSASTAVRLESKPPAESAPATPPAAAPGTGADRLHDRYQALGAAQGPTLREGTHR